MRRRVLVCYHVLLVCDHLPHRSSLANNIGVDAIRPPPNFSYSYPQAAIDIERKAFGANGRDQWPPDDSRYPSGASTPEVFTDVRIEF
jgi:hypothetical protein